MRYVKLSAIHAAAFDRACTESLEYSEVRPLRPIVRTTYPRAIQWHIDRGLFSPCAY